MTKIYDKLDKFRNGLRSKVECVFKDGKIVAEITTRYPTNGMGNVQVFVYDHTKAGFDSRWSYGAAQDCGYDKQAGALECLTVCGVRLSHNWKQDLYGAGFDVKQVGV